MACWGRESIYWMLLNVCLTNFIPRSIASILSSSRKRGLLIWKVLQTDPSSTLPFSKVTRAPCTILLTYELTTSRSSSSSFAKSTTVVSFTDWYLVRSTQSLKKSKDSLEISSCISMSSLQSQSLGSQTTGSTCESTPLLSRAQSSGRSVVQTVTFLPRLFNSKAVMIPSTPAPMTAQFPKSVVGSKKMVQPLALMVEAPKPRGTAAAPNPQL